METRKTIDGLTYVKLLMEKIELTLAQCHPTFLALKGSDFTNVGNTWPVLQNKEKRNI